MLYKFRDFDNERMELSKQITTMYPEGASVYPLGINGMFAYSFLVREVMQDRFPIEEDPNKADFYLTLFFDEVAQKTYSKKGPVFHLIHDPNPEIAQLPWDMISKKPTENIRTLINALGENPYREGLEKTPMRVLKSLIEMTSGYDQDPSEVLVVFPEVCDEMVLLKNIEFHSLCEHHLLPFSGVAHVAYLPNTHVVGVSKLARLVEVFAKRMQIQERLTDQITKALIDVVRCKGAACVIEATHLCMSCRGIQKQNARMVTSSLLGAFKDDPATRQEFFSMIG